MEASTTGTAGTATSGVSGAGDGDGDGADGEEGTGGDVLSAVEVPAVGTRRASLVEDAVGAGDATTAQPNAPQSAARRATIRNPNLLMVTLPGLSDRDVCVEC